MLVIPLAFPAHAQLIQVLTHGAKIVGTNNNNTFI